MEKDYIKDNNDEAMQLLMKLAAVTITVNLFKNADQLLNRLSPIRNMFKLIFHAAIFSTIGAVLAKTFLGHKNKFSTPPLSKDSLRRHVYGKKVLEQGEQKEILQEFEKGLRGSGKKISQEDTNRLNTGNFRSRLKTMVDIVTTPEPGDKVDQRVVNDLSKLVNSIPKDATIADAIEIMESNLENAVNKYNAGRPEEAFNPIDSSLLDSTSGYPNGSATEPL